MKTRPHKLVLAIVTVVTFTACEKLKEWFPHPNPEPQPKDCLLIYKDSTYYVNEEGSQIIKPQFSPDSLNGTFTAEPDGLILDPTTGEIEINHSVSGQTYYITFASKDKRYRCKDSLTISGIDYLDWIYDLTQKEDTAKPIYNADSSNGFPEGGYDVGNDQEQTVREQGVSINPSTGWINLRETIENGALGEPYVNGSNKTFTIYYRLSDRSGSALNKVEVTIYYFTDRSKIPDGILKELEEKRRFPRNGRIGKVEKVPPPLIIATGR